MKFIELFAGIGGFRYGLEAVYSGELLQSKTSKGLQDDSTNTKSRQVGFTCVYANEWDKYAAQIYKKHYGEIDTRDIREVKAEEIPDHDLLAGGFPCQSFSVAGKRGGFEDTRGTLFFEIARILQQKQPRLLLLENVKGLLSHDKGKTFGTILNTLDELGYDCQWQVLNSKNFGVPQNRERVFIIGHLRGTSRPEVFPIGSTDEAVDGYRGIPKVIARGGLQNHAGEMVEQSTALTEAMGKGGGQTPVIMQINKPTHSNDRVYDKSGISPTLNTMQGGNRQPFVAMTEKRTEEAKNIRRETKKRDFSPRRGKQLEPREDNMGNCVTSAQGKEQYLTNNSQIRRLTPTECARLQGFPDDWCEGLSDSQQYKCYGNAVTTNVITAIAEKLIIVV